MGYAQKEVFDVAIFDVNGKFVADIKSPEKSLVIYDEKEDKHFIVVKDALLNSDFLKVVGDENKDTKTVSIGSRFEIKPYKISAKTVVERYSDGTEKYIIVEFPISLLISNLYMVRTTSFDATFRIIEENGELFKFHI